MIRLIVVPREQEFVIRFPEEMLGKTTEILAFSLSEDAHAAPAEEEAFSPNRDTFLSYLQSSGFAARGLQPSSDERSAAGE
jgi:hypothetical protein